MKDSEQLSMSLYTAPTAAAVDEDELRKALAPAEPTKVFSTYWRFAEERQHVFFRRLRGDPGPWTDDPIIRRHKFTNAYRASDRVSQFLIRHVIYGGSYQGLDSPEEVVFRVLLFKLFNRIETWQRLEGAFGPLSWKEYRFDRFDNLLEKAMVGGERLYSAAYIMPAAPRPAGDHRKHRSHLRLLESIIRSGLPGQLARAKSMQAAFALLRSVPSLGDFLAYQFVTDLNYADFLEFSEMEFVVPGPGARDGIAKCFSSLGGLTEIEIIRFVADLQEDMFLAHDLHFPTLWGRRLQLIDCQNVFCEVDKYARMHHPDVSGRTGRTRIKQQFQSKGPVKEVWYPPKWGLNDQVMCGLPADAQVVVSRDK
jgi:hypothetical protein